jgi:hypothetical protein
LSPMDFLEFMWTTSWPVVKESLVLNPESPKIVKFWSANIHVFFGFRLKKLRIFFYLA